MAYNPTSKEFKQLSKEYNLIPIYKEIRADLDTPLSIYLKLAKNSYSFLLESFRIYRIYLDYFLVLE